MFYFRMALPRMDAAGSARRWDICFSLGTSDPAKARMLVGRIKLRLMETTNENKMELANEAVRNQLRDLARTYFLAELERLNETIELDMGTPDWNPEALVADTDKLIGQMRQGLMQGRFPPYIAVEADELLEKHLAAGKNELELKNHLRKLLVRGKMEAERIFRAKVAGDFNAVKIQDELFEGFDVDAIRPIPNVDDETGEMAYTAPASANDLGIAITSFLESKTASGKDPKTVDDIALVLSLFRLIRPDILKVSSITKAVIIDFEVKLSHIPANFTKAKDLKELSYEQLKTAGKDMPKYSGATRDKYRITFRSFIGWCQETDLLPPLQTTKTGEDG